MRDNLFRKYFENQEGIVANDLVNTLSFIPETWKKLHKICEDNIKYFNSYSEIEECKLMQMKQKDYLILKFEILNYIIIDLKKCQNISRQLFESEFFKEHIYDISVFDKPEILVNFYFQNQDVLNLSTTLEYKIFMDNAWTYFFIDFINASTQLGFQTSNQFLYEHLYLNYDLTACKMQDAKAKIGTQKMIEMFSKIKTIKIPTEVIPNDLYEQYKLMKRL